VYAREQGFMKDTPALLLAVLASRDGALFEAVFHRICDNGKMLRNFVQIVRSGATGRRSLGSRPKRAVQRWLKNRSDAQLLAASVGESPSLADIVKMVHPLPDTPARRALYAWLLGRKHEAERAAGDRPRVRGLQGRPHAHAAGRAVPAVDRAAARTSRQWRTIAERAPWQMTRMNLNTFLRHEVFDDHKLTRKIAQRLVGGAGAAGAGVPVSAADGLQAGRPEAPADRPRGAPGRHGGGARQRAGDRREGLLLPDVSGSMHSPVTGHRKGATTQVRCIDVAALVAAAFLRRNPSARS
jgi:60 kDa SS-A/Ro ribonucleoprotein